MTSALVEPTFSSEPASPAVVPKRRRGLFYYLVPAVAFVILWSAFCFYIQASKTAGQGHFIYALDDAYISMAIARNVAENHTWGVHAGEFSSLASSIAWILLIAGAYCFTDAAAREMIPLALNFFFAAMLIALVWHILWQRGVHVLWCFLTLLAVIFWTPIIPVAFTGLEHILQACVTLAFVYAVAQCLADDVPPTAKRGATAALLILAPLATLVRYEGLFLLAVAALLFALRKRFGLALLVVAMGVLPLAIAGVFFMSHGWYFFPTTILLKGNAAPPTSLAAISNFFERGCSNFYAVPHLAVLIGAAVLAFLLFGRNVLRRVSGVMAVVFVGVSLIHLEFAAVGWFFRYESYLVCLGLVTFVLLAHDLPWRSLGAGIETSLLKSIIFLAALVFLANPLIWRGIQSHLQTPRASCDNYLQQYQMARFLNAYYPTAVVAANDIGAINYFADGVHCFDLAGLSELEIAKLRRAGEFGVATIDELTKKRGVKIAIVYTSWFVPYHGLPRSWVKIGTWTIRNTVICGPQVTFFAVDPAEAEHLRKCFEAFEKELPLCQNGVVAQLAPPPSKPAEKKTPKQEKTLSPKGTP
jgi:hypothetical protein